MKRIICCLTAALMLSAPRSAALGEFPGDETAPPLAAASHTETTAYNWYCKKTSDHTQPPLDYLLSFAGKAGAYYVDRKNSDWEAAEKKIYLTFDAGYENGNVEKILDILKKESVPGAFFVLENLATRNPELIRRMADEGHLVCNHTASHRDMSAVTDKNELAAELTRLEEACRSSSGVEIAKYYRPPEGRFSELNLKHASELGYKTVFWSFAYVDWDNNSQLPPDKAVEKVLAGTHNGEVILLHPTSATNAEILGRLIESWKKDGFTFGTLDDLTA